jgi:alkyl hydroperoxide reductase subunit AhpC
MCTPNFNQTTVGTLKLRAQAPKWKSTAVVNGQFKDISIDDYAGKYLVLFFYPMDFTFVCPTEILAFSERVKEFKDTDCEVVACSTDSAFCHLAWTNQSKKEGGLGKLNIPLVSDNTHKISKAYEVYKEDDGTSYRGLFIIDGNQVLRQITINDTQVGRSVDEILRLVQAFQ